MADERYVQIRLDHGAKYPFDGTDVPAPDWAHRAARGVLADLMDRRGVKHELDGIDHDVRVELVETLAAIIRRAHKISL